jgi:hypothetical protein
MGGHRMKKPYPFVHEIPAPICASLGAPAWRCPCPWALEPS